MFRGRHGWNQTHYKTGNTSSQVAFRCWRHWAGSRKAIGDMYLKCSYLLEGWPMSDYCITLLSFLNHQKRPRKQYWSLWDPACCDPHVPYNSPRPLPILDYKVCWFNTFFGPWSFNKFCCFKKIWGKDTTRWKVSIHNVKASIAWTTCGADRKPSGFVALLPELPLSLVGKWLFCIVPSSLFQIGSPWTWTYKRYGTVYLLIYECTWDMNKPRMPSCRLSHTQLLHTGASQRRPAWKLRRKT